MKSQRTLFCLLGLAVMVSAAAGGLWLYAGNMATYTPPIPGKDGGGRRIILLTNSNSPYWFACRAGLHEANKELGLDKANLHAVMVAADGTPQGQVRKLQEFAADADVAAVAISAIDAANSQVAEAMRALKDRGTPVITVDSDIDREMWPNVRTAFIGTDNLAAGRTLGRCAAALRPEGGEYMTFVGRATAQNGIDRIKGFAEGAGDKFKSLGSLSDDQSANKARENVRNAIKNNPNLRTLVGIWSSNAPAIADVVKELDRKKDFTVVVMDADPVAMEQMNEGLIDVMVVQNPYQMGYQAVRLMKALVEKDQATVHKLLPGLETKGGDVYDTGLRVVAPDKETAVKSELFDKGGVEYFKLPGFYRWLDQYTLAGS